MMPAAVEVIDVAGLRQDLARVVTRICPAWLHAHRDDLIQSAVMRVMQVLDGRAARGEGDAPVTSSYLYRAAHSALVDEIRRVRRRRETDLEGEADRVAMTTADPERKAVAVEIGRGIQACLACMKRERRLAVTLHLQGHTTSEAASILDWPVKRTENLVYRGLADLRTCLTAKGMRP
jgi:RNA polymerase sigma-70 factor (ECF subfamily)